MQEIREDIIQAYKKYSINLKFLRSSVEYDDAQGSIHCTPYESNEERLLGLKLNLEEDTIVPDVHLNLYGKHRGDYQGPNMEDKQPSLENITRLTLSRLLPQCYDRTGFLLGPIILALKIFLSRVCEIIEYNHHETEISTVDDELGQMILKFLLQLKISEIKPFPRAWVKRDQNLEGFVIARDGSKSALRWDLNPGLLLSGVVC